MIQIRNRWTGEVIHTDEQAETLRDAVIRAIANRANLGAADLRDANLSAANLRDADLRDADLRDANLRDANLSAANLRDAIGVDLTGADTGNLSEAEYLRIRDEFRARHPEVPIVPQLDATICDIVDGGKGSLDMGGWHQCQTSHCRAGWAIHLAGEAGYALEARFGPERAGGMIYRASTGRWPNFFADTETALKDICAWGEKEKAQIAAQA